MHIIYYMENIIYIQSIYSCEKEFLTELQNQGEKNFKKKTIQKTTEHKKQKIIKIKTPGKQRLNRRLRKKKNTKSKKRKLCCKVLILKKQLGKSAEH